MRQVDQRRQLVPVFDPDYSASKTRQYSSSPQRRHSDVTTDEPPRRRSPPRTKKKKPGASSSYDARKSEADDVDQLNKPLKRAKIRKWKPIKQETESQQDRSADGGHGSKSRSGEINSTSTGARRHSNYVQLKYPGVKHQRSPASLQLAYNVPECFRRRAGYICVRMPAGQEPRVSSKSSSSGAARRGSRVGKTTKQQENSELATAACVNDGVAQDDDAQGKRTRRLSSEVETAVNCVAPSTTDDEVRSFTVSRKDGGRRGSRDDEGTERNDDDDDVARGSERRRKHSDSDGSESDKESDGYAEDFEDDD